MMKPGVHSGNSLFKKREESSTVSCENEEEEENENYQRMKKTMMRKLTSWITVTKR